MSIFVALKLIQKGYSHSQCQQQHLFESVTTYQLALTDVAGNNHSYYVF